MPWWQMYQILCFVSVFSVCSLAECSDSCVLNRHLFGVTVLDHLLHKFNIILSVFLSVSSLEPFFQLIEPAKRCISVVGEFNVFVLQRQQKLVVATDESLSQLFQEILSSLESPSFNVFLYSTKSSSNIILIDCRWICYLLCFLV